MMKVPLTSLIRARWHILSLREEFAAHMRKHIEFVGKTINRWTVLSIPKPSFFECRCDCGKVKTMPSSSVLDGKSKSCGCLQKEVVSKVNKTHGKSYSKVYACWKSMICRCTKPSQVSYRNYGARGIKVCERWKVFENFYEDMGDVPDSHELDRIDVNGDYCKENCRWVTHTQNNRNKRENRKILFNGEMKCLIEICEETDTNLSTVRWRLRNGFSIEEAVKTPIIGKSERKTCVFLEFLGQRKSIAEWSRELKIPYGCLVGRVARGWDTKSALTVPVKQSNKGGR